MARPLRVEYSGAVYHVTSRGNRREDIFEDTLDKKAFLEILAGVVQRFSWFCHAYCLMGNHYHLLIETPKANLSRGMRQLNGVYTQRSNRLHREVGHVFQGRYKAILVEKDSYLLELSRYVVRNPVRAGMVKGPRQWRWSSYRATGGLRTKPSFLTTDWILSQFGKRRTQAQKSYRKFVAQGKGMNDPQQELRGGTVLGTERFLSKIRGRIKASEFLGEVPRSQRLAKRKPLSKLLPEKCRKDKGKRNHQIALAYERHGYTMKEIAEQLDLHYTTVSKAIEREEGKK